jgi:serine/threonine protein kinase
MNREEELFAQLLEAPPPERPGRLDVLCAGEPALRARLANLLAASDVAGDFLEVPPVAPPVAPGEEQPGMHIGRYKLLQKIGEGGCGVVYMAEQDEPVRRRVALKVIKLGMDTKAVVARFEAERQALALMDHPHIARVFDGGATGQGRPYFVMELVRGVRITDFCNQHNLGFRERLELFMLVCHAIQHAHQKGVIHRDLKPSNILVTLNDGEPVPKVIDFGIAKATQGRLTERTLFTAFEQFIGTPVYMSPEQAELSSLDVDTRSDVYSLGVLLYELLAGVPPFDARTLSQSGLDELRRTIREVEPPRPSNRLRTLPGTEQATVAKQRSQGAAQLVSTLCGDLDWIVMKALEKNRSRRYETVSGLAADLRRYLQHEPVAARPPTAAYRLAKLVQRNRLAAAALGALLLSLLVSYFLRSRFADLAVLPAAVAAGLMVGLAVSRVRMLRARRAEREQVQMAQFMRNFFNNLVLLAAVEGDRELLARYLERSTQGLDAEMPGQPEMKAELLETVGSIALNIGQFASAEAKFAKALELRRQAQGADHPEVGRALNHLGMVQSAARKLAEAEKTLREAAVLQRRLPPDAGADLARTLGNLGWVLARQGRLPEAEAVLHEALGMQRPLGESADHALSLKRLGFILLQSGDFAAAESHLTEARDMNIRVLGHDHLEVASALNYLGVALAVQDDERANKVLQAILLYQEALAIRERLKAAGGAHSPNRLSTMLSLQGTLAEIEDLLQEIRHYTEVHHPDDHWKLGYCHALSAVVLLEEKKFAAAEVAARQSYELRRGARPDDWRTFHAAAMWGSALAGLRNFAAAGEPLLLGYSGMKQREAVLAPAQRLWIGRALLDLATFSTAVSRPEEAARRTGEYRAWAAAHPALARILER